MAKNYDRERHRKDGQDQKVLGSPIFLIGIWLIYSIVVSYVVCWLASGISASYYWVTSPASGQFLAQILNGIIPQDSFGSVVAGWEFSNLGNYRVMHQAPGFFWGIELFFSLILVPMIIKMRIRWKPTKHSQYGNDRLATEKEILRQYPQIADRGASFPGYGGIPVAHITPNSEFIKYHPGLYTSYYLCPKLLQLLSAFPGLKGKVKFVEPAKGFYSIDQTTINSLLIGISRSSKGETEVMPLIDILSRAQKKSSMVVNDSKGELYQMSYETLRKRGYEVEVLNIQNPDFSMSYNPLQQIIDYAKDGYYDETQQAVNSLSSSIYVDPNAKDKFWQNSSINLLNALILAVVDHAKRNNNWAEVTMDNVLHMMTELGSKEVLLNSSGDIIPTDDEVDSGLLEMPEDNEPKSQKNKLLVYFAKLQKLNEKNYSKFRQMALDAFAQSKFAGDETSGNIYSSAMEGIKIYQQSDIAKMTSLNSLDFTKLGFPRTFKAKFSDPKYQFKTAIVEFDDLDGNKLEKRTQLIDKVGNLKYAIETTLPDDFVIKISFDYRKNTPDVLGQEIVLRGHKNYVKQGIGNKFKVDPYTKQPILKNVSLKVQNSTITGEIVEAETRLRYSEAPVALFLVTPPNNSTYNQLPAFAIDQAFNILYGMAESNGGRKLFRRVHFILDEFAELPTIRDMIKKISICLGFNMMFDIVVQNLEQLQVHYSEQEAKTIESNCSNILYILTNSTTTAESISKRIGKRTVAVENINGQVGNWHSASVNSQLISQDILSVPELMQFMGGEMVVLRSVYRMDQRGNSISAKPIFDHGKTKMPYRNTFLQKEFNDQTTLSDIGIVSLHRRLDLKEKRINYDLAYKQILDLSGNPQESVSGSFMKDFEAQFNDSIPTEVNDDVISHADSKDRIFTDTELNDHDRLRSLSSNIYSLVHSVQPKEVAMGLFQDTYNYWKNHNSYTELEDLFQGNSALYENAIDFINQFKKGA